MLRVKSSEEAAHALTSPHTSHLRHKHQPKHVQVIWVSILQCNDGIAEETCMPAIESSDAHDSKCGKLSKMVTQDVRRQRSIVHLHAAPICSRWKNIVRIISKERIQMERKKRAFRSFRFFLLAAAGWPRA